jgi:hypothetical protein
MRGLRAMGEGVAVDAQISHYACLTPTPLLSPGFAMNPRWDRCRIDPQAALGLSCFLFQPFQHRIARRIFSIPPAPALPDEFLIEIHAIEHQPALER